MSSRATPLHQNHYYFTKFGIFSQIKDNQDFYHHGLDDNDCDLDNNYAYDDAIDNDEDEDDD